MSAKKSKKKPPRYQINLEVSGEKLESSGDTALEALLGLPRPRKLTTKLLFTITHGDKVFHEMYMPTRAKRLFYPLAQKLLAKNLKHLLTR